MEIISLWQQTMEAIAIACMHLYVSYTFAKDICINKFEEETPSITNQHWKKESHKPNEIMQSTSNTF